MNRLNRFLTLSTVFLALTSLLILTVTPINVQAASTPSVPQFSVKLVDSSYDVPPSSTTTVDQYTGKEITTTKPGYHIEQKSIEVTIKNQPFTPYVIESDDSWQYGPNGQEFNLYYMIQFKGHFGEDWKNFANTYDIYFQIVTVQSDSGYTVVSQVANYEVGSQLDFRVKAVVGYKYNAAYNNAPVIPPQWSIQQTAEQSDWSKVQTFTVPDGSSGSISPTQTATLTPYPTISDDTQQSQSPDQSQPPNNIFASPFFLLGVGTLFGVVLISAVVLVIHKRQLKTKTYL
jgi:hypothetical protein